MQLQLTEDIVTLTYIIYTRPLPCLSIVLHAIHVYSRSSPGGKAVGEDVPMDDNPAYGEVHIYDTVKEWNGN